MMEQSPSSNSKLYSSGELFNQLGMPYEDMYGHSAGIHQTVPIFLEFLPTSNARVLDCGCGTGKPVAHMLAARGLHVFGIDVSQTMVDLSRKQVPSGTFERANMLEYKAPSEGFHAVVVSLALFVFEREETTIMASKWFQWLQPGGVILLVTIGAEDCKTTPEMFDSDGEFARRIPVRFMDRNLSITLFTKQGWNKVLSEAGFELVYTQTIPFVPPAEARSDDEMQYFVIARKPVTA